MCKWSTLKGPNSDVKPIPFNDIKRWPRSGGRCAYKNIDEAPPLNAGCRNILFAYGKRHQISQPDLLLKVAASQAHNGLLCSRGDSTRTHFTLTPPLGHLTITSKHPPNVVFYHQPCMGHCGARQLGLVLKSVDLCCTINQYYLPLNR